jgi:hypothetical protein
MAECRESGDRHGGRRPELIAAGIIVVIWIDYRWSV